MKRFTISATAMLLFLFPPSIHAQDPDFLVSTGSQVWVGVTLTWTAPGDDHGEGIADTYDIRYSTSYITEYNWSNATPFAYEPSPRKAGTRQHCDVSGLVENRVYYFALKTADECDNWSTLSNVFVARAESHPYLCGDMNDDGYVSIADITRMISFVFQDGDPPSPIESGNVNGSTDHKITISDIAYMIRFVFRDGPEPDCL